MLFFFHKLEYNQTNLLDCAQGPVAKKEANLPIQTIRPLK